MQYIWKCAIFIAGAGGQINRVAQTMSLARAPWMEHKLLAVSWINLKQRKARLTVKCGGRRAAVQSPGPTGLSRAHREEENAVTRAQACSSTQDPGPKVEVWDGAEAEIWKASRNRKPLFHKRKNSSRKDQDHSKKKNETMLVLSPSCGHLSVCLFLSHSQIP